MKRHNIGHTAILASAGSGKTQSLAYRFIRLMLNGADPESICAMTFTRKAAGEIRDRIIRILAAASTDAEQCSRTAAELDADACTCETFRSLLRRFLERMHRVQVGTLDSFCVGVVRAFAGEFGIDPDFELSEGDDAAARHARRSVMLSMFRDMQDNPEMTQSFIDITEAATAGAAKKQKVAAIEEFLRDCHSIYKILPHSLFWGDPRQIWSNGLPYGLLPPNAASDAVDRFMKCLALKTDHKSVLKGFGKLLSEWQSYKTESVWEEKWNASKVAKMLLEELPSMGIRPICFAYYGKDIEFAPNESGLLREVIENVMYHEINLKLKVTRGIYDIVNRFHDKYTESLSKQGVLSFDDVQHLLSDTRFLSRVTGTPDKLYIDYRLDRRLDHLLLDEFQDTSDLQMKVIENLVDEIIQDDSGNRTFFLVGDVKQAIYGWRGGNPTLTDRILDHYPNIERETLDTCRRSHQSVIDLVNAVFSDLGSLPENFREAVAAWKAKWRTHTVPAENHAPSFAGVIRSVPEDGDERDDRWLRAAFGVLEETDPVGRGISTGILFRKNEDAETLYHYLRAKLPHMPMSLEKAAGFRENPVIEIIVSLIRFASHPGDTFSWRHVQMSPLSSYLKSEYSHKYQIASVILEQIDRAGFAGMIRFWQGKLAGTNPLNGYEHHLLCDLVDLAVEFDVTGNRNGDRFIDFLEKATLAETGSTSGIQIMSVHKAKGLGFDMVIVPKLCDFLEVRDRLGLECNRASSFREIHWTLDMPRKLIREADPVLRDASGRMKTEKAFEELCTLYVAMTRARRGLYLIMDADKGELFNLFEQMQSTGGNAGPEICVNGLNYPLVRSVGDRFWYGEFRRKPEQAPPGSLGKSIPVMAFGRETVRPVQHRTEPSAASPGHYRSVDFTAGNSPLDQGIMLHELLSKVEWTDTFDPEQLAQIWSRDCVGQDALKTPVIRNFLTAMQSPEIRNELKKPEGQAILWREKPFDTIVDGEWIAGQFDRVVIRCDTDGRMISAVIQDFKSNRIDSPSELDRLATDYAGQMDLYAVSLANITGIDPLNIEKQLLFTAAGKVVRV